jgi:6-phosphogluconolactonase
VTALQKTRWHLMQDPAALATEVARITLVLASDAIALRGEFRMVLAGGTTPAAAYRQLATADAAWPDWQIYFGDERCLPQDHPERNDVMAAHNWLDSVGIPPENVHRIPAERGAETAACAYTKIVQAATPFDLVLLGMGEDGHTASLFPGHEHVAAELVHPVHAAPKPPAERVTLSLAVLNNTRNMLVLASGRNKQDAIRRWKGGAVLPVAAVHGKNGVDVYLDTAAAP